MVVNKLSGHKVAYLVANGFQEQDLTETQRALIGAGAAVRNISADQGIISGWDGAAWGHHYAVDTVLNQALGVDYTMLVIPGGQRSLEKLKLNPHSRRFISSFVESEKPIIIMGDALELMINCEQITGRTVSGPENVRMSAEQAGAIWDEEMMHIDSNMMSGRNDSEYRDQFIESMMEFVSSYSRMEEAA